MQEQEKVQEDGQEKEPTDDQEKELEDGGAKALMDGKKKKPKKGTMNVQKEAKDGQKEPKGRRRPQSYRLSLAKSKFSIT